MNVYEFVKVRPAPQFFVIKEETGGSEYFSFHLFPHLMMIVQPPIQEFFSIFFQPPIWISRWPERYNPPFQRFVRM